MSAIPLLGQFFWHIFITRYEKDMQKGILLVRRSEIASGKLPENYPAVQTLTEHCRVKNMRKRSIKPL